ncbi:Rossmann-like alpha/beta/alpha sandwich fold protein [Ascosphaera apis ARSEF 7405]|uniref:Rossmann-like alpha/beta/alpha sandwich fold protein n=1 Tax=Ascosphaera apis ARSEF 7405 TaxID=392613 RepID=A0A167UWZ8_9EURO|nr:Rossmann-like alpha/beta/alpha sandwich fold protein [Ascosphaera apis ARSEF 7405]
MTTTIPKGNFHHDGILLLPAPHSTSFSSLKAAYGSAVREALTGTHKAANRTGHIAVLDIAVGINGLQSQDASQQSRIYPIIQRLLANMYKLAGLVAVQERIDLDVPGGVDVRVFFLDEDSVSEQAALKTAILPSIQDLATSKRSWNSVWAVKSSTMDVLLASLQRNDKAFEHDRVHIVKSPYDHASTRQSSLLDESGSTKVSHHYSVAVGGTFDHLHIGHKLLLSAVWLALDADPPHETKRLMTVGITGDELLVNKKYAQVLESWEKRWEACWRYYESIIDLRPSQPGDRRTVHRVDEPGPNGKYVLVDALPDLQIKFVQISDPFGPTITDEKITALVVSGETRSGGKAVNDKRRENGWKDLDIFEIDVLDLKEEDAGAAQESFETKISSTEIRKRMMETTKGSL